MTLKFLTALAWIVGPLPTILGISWMIPAIVPKSERDTSWAQVTIVFMAVGVLGDAWLIARYLL
jgi:hypothetical protein